MFSSHLFRAPFGVPFFLVILALAAWTLSFGHARAAESVVTVEIGGSDFQSAHDALVEAIEAEGMVVGAVLPFGDMLERTGRQARQGTAGPYRNAELVQFCSARLAHRMVDEDPGQIVFCPLTIAIYVTTADPSLVVMAYRVPGEETPARRQAGVLLARVVEQAARLARLRW